MVIQEPLNLNPSGLKNLTSLYTTIPDYFPLEFLSYPVAGDALPSVTLSRMSHDNVYCWTHKTLIKLSDQDEVSMHIKPECHIDWPFKDVHRITGDSHEVSVNLLKSKCKVLAANFTLNLKKHHQISKNEDVGHP